MNEPRRKCGQCGESRPYPSGFLGARGQPINWCTTCQAHYRGWTKKTAAEKLATPRRGVPVLHGTLRARLFPKSGNRKLGGIPVSITSRSTCPPSCAFYGAGCYAEYFPLAHHWRRVGTDRSATWTSFLEEVRWLAPGQLWRHNVAGDLPGDGRAINRQKLDELVGANLGRRGFSFTHHSYTNGPDIETVLNNQGAIRHANRNGFTVNISTDSLEQADRVARFQSIDGCVPVVVVVPSDAPLRLRTPEGRRVTICPAETEAKLTCAECELCANPKRKAIVGFRAHGQFYKHVDDLVQLRQKETTS